MAPGFDEGWFPYVPVAERRKQAARELEKLRKKGHPVAPVILEGRTIARTFWGKAWCANLESYRDYENRLSRGRAYVRHGAVIDLQIAPLEISARVSGSSIYRVSVSITAVAPALWRSLCEGCAGGIDSLVELLQGRFSKGVMERICRQDQGLFPKPSQIRFSCTCPDGASMCKHVAAVLYGVGARLDETPELLFRLRAVDEKDLVADLDQALPLSNRPLDAGKVLETDDLSALFGLDMEEAGGPVAAHGAPPVTPDLADRPDTKASRRKKVIGDGSTPTALDADMTIAQPLAVPKLASARQGPETRSAGKAARAANSGKLSKHTSPLSKGHTTEAEFGRARDTKKRKTAKSEMELTPDGFIKWWT
jgi:uncharacterized Zn finger protein